MSQAAIRAIIQTAIRTAIRTTIRRYLSSVCLSVLPSAVLAQTVAEHMDVCKDELGFSAVPAGSCFGPNTVEVNGPGSEGIERLGHFRLGDRVDAVLFCRDVDEVNQTAAFVALIMHNRDTGKTCFLDAVFNPDGISLDFPSPTNNSTAEEYWAPATNCVGCHATGPYIITRTAGAMARFGLMNDGHDTYVQKYEVVGANETEVANANLSLLGTVIENSCAYGCHVLSDNTMIHSKVDLVLQEGMMPPGPESDFRWVNRDTPNASGDWETLSGVAKHFPYLHCNNPTRVDARVVGRDYVYTTATGFPDKLERFNAKDGLVCRNSDQADNSCNDYHVRFLCNGSWSRWYDRDSPSGSGDRETTDYFNDLCSSPSEIQARTSVSGETIMAHGTPDRLHRFSTGSGLACRHEDQPDGKKCNNYSVKFVCP